MERDQRAHSLGQFLERPRAQRFLCQQSRQHVFGSFGRRRHGFSGRRPLLCAGRPGPGRTFGSGAQKSQHSSTSDFAQCDEGHRQLDFVPLARTKEQSRRDWRRCYRGGRRLSPDKIPSGRLRISKPACQGAFLWRWQIRRHCPCLHPLAQRIDAGVRASAHQPSHPTPRELCRFSRQAFCGFPSCLCAVRRIAQTGSLAFGGRNLAYSAPERS